jgi:hypothetical protein
MRVGAGVKVEVHVDIKASTAPENESDRVL